MESTPVGVIVGLFSAISQKLPAFQEWETRKHHHLLNSNPAVCEALTEVRQHVTRHGRSFYCVITLLSCLHALQIIIYDLDVIRPLTVMTLILSVANSLRSLSFVLLPVSVYFAMIKLRSYDSDGMEKGDFPLRFCMPVGHCLW